MGVAQFGSALEWGSRGRGFKSLHPYQKKILHNSVGFFLRFRHQIRDLNGWESPPAECEHIKCMSPFLTCFPLLPTAEPYGQGNTRRAHIKRRRLIMPLVALVQKNRAHPQLRTNSGAWHSLRSSPLLLQFRL